MSESTIRADSPVVTLINVFSVAPENQARLLEAWQRSTDEVIRHLPGFVSANIHASLDGTKVVNYAQWETREAFASMLTGQPVVTVRRLHRPGGQRVATQARRDRHPRTRALPGRLRPPRT